MARKQTKWELLENAIASGDRWEIDHAIKMLPRIRGKASVMQNAYHATKFAVKLGDVETVKRLISKGVDINATNRWGNDDFMCEAIYVGNQKMIDELINLGIDIYTGGESNPILLRCKAMGFENSYNYIRTVQKVARFLK